LNIFSTEGESENYESTLNQGAGKKGGLLENGHIGNGHI
jgi:hypothetical protein